MKRLLRSLFHRDNLIATGLIFGLFWLIGEAEFEALNPIGDAFADVELTDVVYSQFDKNSEYRIVKEGVPQTLDTNVVIINASKLPRGGIAEQIDIIELFEPQVIGIDIEFHMDTDPRDDSLLEASLSRYDNIVMVSVAQAFEPESGESEVILYSNPRFSSHAQSGIANLETEDLGMQSGNFNVCRRYITKTYDRASEKEELCFAYQLLANYAPEKLEEALARGKLLETINYTGNIAYFEPKPRFTVYDWYDVFDGNLKQEDITGKIVLIGFLGANLDDRTGEDKFYTPLNDKYIGKAAKDMYGVVIHANIISMVMEGLYIEDMPEWAGHLLGVILVYLTFACFRPIYNNYKIWYDGLTKVLALAIAAILLFFVGFIFAEYDYKIRFPAIYFGAILLSGDFLEIYYGLIKNSALKLNERRLRKKNRSTSEPPPPPIDTTH